MKAKNSKDDAAKAAFLKRVAALWPVARGTVSLVRVRDEAEMRKAVENGRRLEALLAEEGVRLVESLRAEADAD